MMDNEGNLIDDANGNQ
jgi:hypothetical protein